MEVETTVEFIRSSSSLVLTVDWPSNLPTPPKGLRVIEMPNSHHKGIAMDRNEEYYHCIHGPDGYVWRLAEDRHELSAERSYR